MLNIYIEFLINSNTSKMFIQWIYLNILQKIDLHLKIYYNVSQTSLILLIEKIKRDFRKISTIT